MYGPLNLGMSEEEAEKSAVESLELVGISKEYYHLSPMELSGGQKRCVAIAGVLAMQPEKQQHGASSATNAFQAAIFTEGRLSCANAQSHQPAQFRFPIHWRQFSSASVWDCFDIFCVGDQALEGKTAGVMRNMILDEGKRLDGRRTDEIRPIWCEVGYLPAAHGI